MRFISSIASAIFIFLVFSLNALGLPGESIVLDPASGNYIVNYLGFDNSGDSDVPTIPRQVIFVPATKIDPSVGSIFIMQDTDIVYSYRLNNGSKSQQSLVSFILDPVSDIASSIPLPKRRHDIDLTTLARANLNQVGRNALVTPRGWYGSAVTSNSVGLRIGWMWTSLNAPNAGLIAGSSQSGFGFSSKDLPGIGAVQFRGNTPAFGFVDEGPTGEIEDQLENLRQNNFVLRYAAVPAISVPASFDAAVLLDSIRTQVKAWPSKQLLDPTFASQLDGYMAAAAQAYRSNQPKAGKEDIDAVRKLLAHEHQNLDHDDEYSNDTPEHTAATRLTIDRLAARVLDFDLRYILTRIDQENGHDR